jgi:transcription elongation factor Elf1
MKYTIFDVLKAGYTLSPLTCLCCGSSEVTYNQGIGDAHCGDCGEWQMEYVLENNLTITETNNTKSVKGF